MTEIIDLHSHVLPGLDDGAENMEESIRMLRLAWGQGIKGVVATPHYSNDFTNICVNKIRALCTEVQEKICVELKAEFHVWPGQEIMYSEDAVRLLDEGKLLTIADSGYVLVEFLPETVYSYIFRAVKELILAGYHPIIAHAERYQALRDQEKLQEIRAQGAYIQLNFRSAGGRWYNETTKWCRKVLREGSVDFLGTDMHNIKERGPETGRAVAWMSKSLDCDYTEAVLKGNALKILGDKYK